MTDSLLLVQPVAKLTHNLKGLLLWWWDSQSKLELREKQRTRTDPNSSQHRFTATLPLEQNKEAHVFLSSREIVLRRRLCAVPWQEVVSRLCTHHNRRVNFKTLGAWTGSCPRSRYRFDCQCQTLRPRSLWLLLLTRPVWWKKEMGERAQAARRPKQPLGGNGVALERELWKRMFSALMLAYTGFIFAVKTRTKCSSSLYLCL